MRHTLVELLHLVLGLLLAAGLTWGAAWAYPLGREEIWWCGLFAMAATALMGVGPMRRAIALDRRRP